jgi:hypothetical protein
LNEEVINKAIAKKELMLKKVKELYEVNPMLGSPGRAPWHVVSGNLPDANPVHS